MDTGICDKINEKKEEPRLFFFLLTEKFIKSLDSIYVVDILKGLIYNMGEETAKE